MSSCVPRGAPVEIWGTARSGSLAGMTGQNSIFGWAGQCLGLCISSLSCERRWKCSTGSISQEVKLCSTWSILRDLHCAPRGAFIDHRSCLEVDRLTFPLTLAWAIKSGHKFPLRDIIMARYATFIDPMARIRSCDFGIFNVCHVNMESACWLGSWLPVSSRASIDLGPRKPAATGRIWSNFSTARKVTTSGGCLIEPVFCNDSARAAITSTFVNVSARVTSRRKAAFL